MMLYTWNLHNKISLNKKKNPHKVTSLTFCLQRPLVRTKTFKLDFWFSEEKSFSYVEYKQIQKEILSCKMVGTAVISLVCRSWDLRVTAIIQSDLFFSPYRWNPEIKKKEFASGRVGKNPRTSDSVWWCLFNTMLLLTEQEIKAQESNFCVPPGALHVVCVCVCVCKADGGRRCPQQKSSNYLSTFF